jgi:cation diffusion facilitator family transporter
MHSHSILPWEHHHAFLGAQHDRNERRTWLVVLITAVTMVAEIIGGQVYGSMALVADGWHMASHTAALGITAFAYRFARRYAHDQQFSFGTGKLGELAGFSSAVILAIVAAFIAYESVARYFSPVPISYNEAITLAALGLGVNLVCAWLLREDHGHDHHHGHGHARDHNLGSAYAHVLTDALTSILAIVALLTARFYGWIWMDAAVGIIGAIVIGIWSLNLIRSSGAVLLDMVPDDALHADVRERLELEGDKVSDLHVWHVGPGHTAVIASLVSHAPQDPAVYKARLDGIPGLSHVTIEVHACPDHAPVCAS